MSRGDKILITISILGIIAIIFLFKNRDNIFNKKVTELPQTDDITIVPTMSDKITADSTWCGTFQLVWNDMKRELVKKDIEMYPQLKIVENLNKEEFNENMISEEYYYKKYGIKTLELKAEIENGIKEKFNQTSNVLNDMDWSEEELSQANAGIKRYIFYSMLYRKFEFLQEFDKLENSMFGDKYENVKYFGIKKNTKNSVRDQLDILYYNSEDDFAILINTKSDDEVILCKTPNGENFNEIYENMKKESNEYTGNKKFRSNDEFKAPNLKFNQKKEYRELENKIFETDGGIGEIRKAIQTIEFSIDESGGEVKSESIMDVTDTTSIVRNPKEEKARYFYLDDTFAIFLREKGKELPYFAGRIEDITKFQ